VNDEPSVESLAPSVRYHLSELEIVRNLADRRRSVPKLQAGETRVLDVGCGIGQTLLASEIESATVRCGVDIDPDAIRYGNEHFPFLDLRATTAERLPFDDQAFDLVISRVALPYTNVPEAFREIARVLRPGGRVWAVLHTWRMELRRVPGSFTSVKDFIDRLYVTSNSLSLHVVGRSFGRPWNGRHESVQTSSSIRRMLNRTGFTEIDIQRSHRFLVEAKKR
jgi:ubiquinone/menaquinone biosynthesis C-methylase UbiE